MSTTNLQTTFEVMGCIYDKCGFTYALPQTYVKQCQKDGGYHWCPKCGDRQGWDAKPDPKVAEIANLKRTLAETEDQRRRAEGEAEHFRKSRDGMKGQLALVKKRLANGICPCCNRYFVELHRHMTTKHSDFLAETGILTLLETPTATAFDSAVDKLTKGKSSATVAQYRSVCRALKGFLFPEANQ